MNVGTDGGPEVCLDGPELAEMLSTGALVTPAALVIEVLFPLLFL